MYYVLYDRHLRTIGKTYLLESWSRTQRAYDFDAMSITGEQIPLYADPFLVVINDRQGRIVFSGLASTPEIDDKSKKTTITLKDYRTLWNTEVSVELGSNNLTPLTPYVWEYIDTILSAWISAENVGLANITWDLSRVSHILLDNSLEYVPGKQIVHVYDTLSGILSYYNIYCVPKLDLYSKTLTFVFYAANLNTVSIRLSDFGINKIEKSFGEYNRVHIYKHDLTFADSWGITEDNSVVRLPTDKDLVYPAKIKTVVADEPSEEHPESAVVNQAIYDAVMDLAQNRYQENIDINVVRGRSVIDLSGVDFSYSVQVYTDQGAYKMLPVGEIQQDSKGTHIIRIGYRIQELTQEI